MTAKLSVLGLILSSYQNLRFAIVRFPLKKTNLGLKEDNSDSDSDSDVTVILTVTVTEGNTRGAIRGEGGRGGGGPADLIPGSPL